MAAVRIPGLYTGQCLGYRHCLMLLGFCGLAICYIMRISPGIAIIDMVEPKNRPTVSKSTNASSLAKRFDWSSMEQNTILSSFFYTYFLMQLPAGWASQRIGGKWTFAAGVSFCGLVAGLTPTLVTVGGFTAFLLLRLSQGMFQGLCYPSIHRLAGSWFPPHEFACLCGIMHSGYIFGTVLALSCSGYLIKSGGSNGWPMPFYVSGLLAFVWLPAWIIFVSESPSSHPWISTAEKHYIEGSLRLTSHRDQRAVPWRRLFRSTQVWLIMSCFILDGWSNYTLLVCVPQYMHSVLDVPINENGLLSSLPYIAAMGFMYVITFVDGLLIRRNYLSMRNMRKLWSCLGAFGKAVLLLTIAYLDRTYKTTIVVLLIINVMLSSAALLGFNLADLDLAPPYAGFLFSVFNACSTFSGIVAPLVVGLFTSVYPAPVAWQNVFILAAAISCLCGVVYGLFVWQAPLNWIVQEQSQPILVEHETSDTDSAESNPDEPLLVSSVKLHRPQPVMYS
ncbi:Vesicular glutamate transporter 3 [Paragonimus heterotremus]|uniref:Vesicular glutamate transporter 3 n=1 Tax=Paragonimus heterotremus TaxID=100268 RepID=A0A8J4SRN2_9TREM|nr:Vesicular glutamate transporter 3 [Paragonimus heterotremus]